jgi:adenosylhomocysteine nucleosidase
VATELTFTDPCLIFALRRESRPFLRQFRPHQRFPGAPCRAHFCGPAWLTVLVLETGIGQGATERAVDWLLSRPVLGNVPYRPGVVLSAGFSGALHAQYQIGDVILATEVANTAGNRWPASWPGDLPPGEWRPPLHRGRVLTAPQLVGDVEQKGLLGRQHEAVAVDMETAVVAQRCTQHGVPFGCVRAISDDLGEPLSPRLVACLSTSRVSPLRLAATLVRSPGLMGDLWRLAKQTKLAAEQLAAALGELLTLTLPFGAEL